jgi:RNA polymerase sigma-70 factor (ECF subfamily)
MTVFASFRTQGRRRPGTKRSWSHDHDLATENGIDRVSATSDPAPVQTLATLASDEELLRHYRDSQRPEDFAELTRRYSGELGRYLTRYLGDAALAEDALQDTLLLVHSKCSLYRDGCPARPWLYAVAIHRAIDTQRRARRMPSLRFEHGSSEGEPVKPGSLLETLAQDEPGPLEQLEEQERQSWVRKQVANLPENYRQVLVLAYDRELSYAEIAGLLGIPVGTVKSRLHGAIARLRALADRFDRTGSP